MNSCLEAHMTIMRGTGQYHKWIARVHPYGQILVSADVAEDAATTTDMAEGSAEPSDERSRKLRNFQSKFSGMKIALQSKASEFATCWTAMASELPMQYWGCLPQLLLIGVSPTNKQFCYASPLFSSNESLAKGVERLSTALALAQQLAIDSSAAAVEDGTACLPGEQSAGDKKRRRDTQFGKLQSRFSTYFREQLQPKITAAVQEIMSQGGIMLPSKIAAICSSV